MYSRAGPCALARATPVWAENRVEREKRPWNVRHWLAYGQAGALFPPQENFRPIKLGRKYIFYANLQPTPADEMYQDFENPEHGKFWSGGKSPVIGT